MQTEMLALYKMSNAICFLIYNSLQNHVTLALHVMVARAWKVDVRARALVGPGLAMPLVPWTLFCHNMDTFVTIRTLSVTTFLQCKSRQWLQKSLLESENQVEILESRIMISTFILSIFPYIMNHVMHKPLFGK